MAKYLCKKEVRGPEGTLLCVPGKVYDLFGSEDIASTLCEDGTPHMIPYSIVEENFSVVAPYIVVVVMEHEVDAIDYADDLEEALKKANTALDVLLARKAHITSGGIKHYASLEGIAFQTATAENMHAWYSGSPFWDAHIIAL